MMSIKTKFERNQHLLTKSTLYQIGWLDAESDKINNIVREYHLRCSDLSGFSDDTCLEYLCGARNYYSNWKATSGAVWGGHCDYLSVFPILQSCLNKTFFAMEGPIKDYGFTTEWKALAVADGTIFMFDYGGINLVDCYGPDYRDPGQYERDYIRYNLAMWPQPSDTTDYDFLDFLKEYNRTHAHKKY